MSYFDSRRILVTGGASFIGSHLVKALVRSGARVSIVDDLSSGTVKNLSEVLPEIDLVTGDLKDPEFAPGRPAEARRWFSTWPLTTGAGAMSTYISTPAPPTWPSTKTSSALV